MSACVCERKARAWNVGSTLCRAAWDKEERTPFLSLTCRPGVNVREMVARRFSHSSLGASGCGVSGAKDRRTRDQSRQWAQGTGRRARVEAGPMARCAPLDAAPLATPAAPPRLEVGGRPPGPPSSYSWPQAGAPQGPPKAGKRRAWAEPTSGAAAPAAPPAAVPEGPPPAPALAAPPCRPPGDPLPLPTTIGASHTVLARGGQWARAWMTALRKQLFPKLTRPQPTGRADSQADRRGVVALGGGLGPARARVSGRPSR